MSDTTSTSGTSYAVPSTTVTQMVTSSSTTATASATSSAPVSPSLDAEVSYISGVTSTGSVAATSFATWNGDGTGDPDATTPDTIATYNTTQSNASKWAPGGPDAAASVIGSPGGTQYYFFDPASNFTAAQQTALSSGLSLWSAVANIQFVQITAAQAAANPSLASLDFRSTPDGGTYESAGNVTPEAIGSTTLNNQGAGTYLTVNIDPSNGGFNLGDFNDGGAGVGVILHEEGHFLGLGHSGPYNGNVNPATQQFSAYDSHEYSLMSYIGANNPADLYAASNPNPGATNYGDSTTWMPLDILAVQRLYGVATTGPLSGGQVFGYNDNVDGTVDGVGIHDYFDFSAITTPVVTLYDTGSGNTLDLSGDNSAETIDLRPGDYSSFAGDTDNLAIAYGTAIDTFVGGTAGTNVTVNGDADTITDQGTGNTVTFSGTFASYVVAAAGAAGDTVTSIATGITDVLTDVQTLVFSDQTVQTSTIPCYVRGTRILTARGEVAVEQLQVGDLLVTTLGRGTALKPVTWLGHRSLDLRRQPRPGQLRPIRIQAGALGEHQPHRDLLLSPGHRLKFAGSLVCASDLVNGATITQESPASVEYWHVEVEGHDVLLAEGVEAESYHDTGNRPAFEEGAVTVLHPVLDGDASEPCLPYAEAGAELRERLALRAEAMGWRRDREPLPWLEANGRRIEPVRKRDRYRFALPANCSVATLHSRFGRPCDSSAAVADDRQLGVLLNRLTLCGPQGRLEIGLEHGLLGRGFHAVERDEQGWEGRWTDGAAVLRLESLGEGREVTAVEIGLDREMLFWVAPGRLASTLDAVPGQAVL